MSFGNPMQLFDLFKGVLHCNLFATSDSFWHGCITCKIGRFDTRSDAYKKAPHAVYLRYMQFTC